MPRFVGSIVFVALVGLSLISATRAAPPDTAPRPLPTKGEAKIIAALAAPTKIDFDQQPLSGVVNSLEQLHEIEIQLDERALTDAGVGTDTPITMHLEGISLRSALRLMLAESDLTYVVRNGYLLVTSKTEAENKLTFKIYPVRDLVTSDSQFSPPLQPGEKADSDFQSLIGLITSVVAPTSWDEVGGPGQIQEYRQSPALAFSQTEEVHEDTAALLAALRRVRDVQVAIAKTVDRPATAPVAAKDKSPHIKVYWLFSHPGGMGFMGGGYMSHGGAGGGMGGGVFMLEEAAEPKQSANVPPPAPATASAADPKPESKDAGVAAALAAAAQTAAAEDRLNAWVKDLVQVVPELIEPETWQPKGEGLIRAVAGTIVVSQSDEIQQKVAGLLQEIMYGRRGPLVRREMLPPRLTLSGPRVDWPHEAEPRPRPSEAPIYQALDSKLAIDFADQPLADVIKTFRQALGIRIYVDLRALTDAGVATDTPMTRNARGLNFRTVLRLMLEELDLTYVIRNEVLVITSKTEAENLLVTKVYPVFDLVVRTPDSPPHAPALDFQSLTQALTRNIEPTTWDEVGGPGSIREFTNAGALVISQTTDIQEQIADFLKALREVAAVQK